jgi:multisubunit Na+/H+ antiporter MnhG subunit
MKWIIATALALLLFSGLSSFLGRYGLGRLPGDFRLTWRGRTISIPLTSTLLLSAIVALMVKVL